MVMTAARTSFWVARRDWRERATRRIAAVGLDLSPLRGVRARPGAIWAVGMVRNEADIIGATVENLLDQGVERVVMADNGSTDDTAARAGAFDGVTVVEDSCQAYYQSDKITLLARAAARAGAEWIVPFDADELWTAPGGLARFLADIDADIVRAHVWNYVPTSDDPADEPDPVRRLQWRQVDPAFDPKWAFRGAPARVRRSGEHQGRPTRQGRRRHSDRPLPVPFGATVRREVASREGGLRRHRPRPTDRVSVAHARRLPGRSVAGVLARSGRARNGAPGRRLGGRRRAGARSLPTLPRLEHCTAEDPRRQQAGAQRARLGLGAARRAHLQRSRPGGRGRLPALVPSTLGDPGRNDRSHVARSVANRPPVSCRLARGAEPLESPVHVGVGARCAAAWSRPGVATRARRGLVAPGAGCATSSAAPLGTTTSCGSSRSTPRSRWRRSSICRSLRWSISTTSCTSQATSNPPRMRSAGSTRRRGLPGTATWPGARTPSRWRTRTRWRAWVTWP